jgi:hypothetical protein
MNYKALKSLSYVIFAIGMFSNANGQQTWNLFYGSFYDPSNTASIFTNEAQAALDSTNQGMMAFGYFDAGFDVSSEAGALNETNFGNFISSFNVIHEASFASSSEGYLNQDILKLPDAGVGVGKMGYTITLAGVDSWTNAASATEIGLFNNSTWDTIPAASITPANLEANPVSYDTVLLGAEFLGVPGSGSWVGVNTNLYATQSIPSAVPEPSTYAMMLGVFTFGFVYYKRRMKGKQTAECQMKEPA